MANDPFFASGGNKRKRPSKPSRSAPSNGSKAVNGRSKSSEAPNTIPREDSDEVLSSDDDSQVAADADEPLSDEEDNERETAAQKRLRLAKIYLENLQTQHKQDGFDAADLDKDYLEQRLQSDVVRLNLAVWLPLKLNPSYSSLKVENFT